MKKWSVDDCSKDDKYIYEYNNICYDSEEKIKDINSDYIIKSNIDEITENNQISQYIDENESTNKIIENESTNKIIENESTNKIEENESTNKIIENESTNKIVEDESTNKIVEDESTSKIVENESTSKIVEDESTNKIVENESTNKIEVNESTNKIVEDEITNKIIENESTNKIIEDEITNKIVENEITNKIVENESTNKIIENESTNKIVENESTNKIVENENTNKIVENENTNKIVENESTNKIVENESTNKIVENESTNKVEENENTNKVEENENTNKIEVVKNTEKNEIIKQFSSENFFKETQNTKNTNKEDISKKDEIINNIKEALIKGYLDTLLQNVTNGTKQDLIATDKDIIYQITTSDNQKNNNYSNISTINLGECENKLKEIYHIDNNLSLIILKIDYFMPGLLIPVIGYEVYDPRNKTQLDLNYCKDFTIKLNIPVSINESNIFKHDPNSEYYNDECNRYTTDNGTDILLNDRQNEYIENNLSLCEDNCTFKGYDKDTKKALCECETKPKIGLISEIILDENILSNDFNTTDNTTSNIATMKCVDTLFSKDGLITNIGSYLLLFSFAFNSISAIIFYKCGYHIIESNIIEVINLKSITNNKINIYGKKHNNINKKKKNKQKKNKKKKNSLKYSNPIKRNSKKSTRNFAKEKAQNQISSTKLQIKSVDIKFNLEGNKRKKINFFEKQNIEQKNINYKNCELNSFNFKMAFKYDKRTFLQYYTSLLLSKHILLFSFCPVDDYNIKIIKITLFFLSFDIYFAVNTFFFNDSTIHQIYEDGGEYNLSYFMPKILISFIISYFIISLIRYFSLSERFLTELRNEDNLTKEDGIVQNTKRCLIIKYIIFYVLSFIFLIFFWFYLSSFCAIFQNTQIYVIKNTFISFGISFLFPFIYELFPCILRIYSLKNNNECIYKFSKIIQLLWNISLLFVK